MEILLIHSLLCMEGKGNATLIYLEETLTSFHELENKTHPGDVMVVKLVMQTRSKPA